jgi:hypothetical protein
LRRARVCCLRDLDRAGTSRTDARRVEYVAFTTLMRHRTHRHRQRRRHQPLLMLKCSRDGPRRCVGRLSLRQGSCDSDVCLLARFANTCMAIHPPNASRVALTTVGSNGLNFAGLSVSRVWCFRQRQTSTPREMPIQSSPQNSAQPQATNRSAPSFVHCTRHRHLLCQEPLESITSCKRSERRWRFVRARIELGGEVLTAGHQDTSHQSVHIVHYISSTRTNSLPALLGGSSLSAFAPTPDSGNIVEVLGAVLGVW